LAEPVLPEDTLFITTIGEGDDGGGSGNGEEGFCARKIHLPEMKIRLENWRQK